MMEQILLKIGDFFVLTWTIFAGLVTICTKFLEK